MNEPVHTKLSRRIALAPFCALGAATSAPQAWAKYLGDGIGTAAWFLG